MTQIQKITMKELPISERPYEKLEMNGSENLSNAELLAVILKTGTKEETSVQLAQRILNLNKQDSCLTSLYQISLEELQQIKGIGRVKSIQVKAVMELSKRIHKQESKKKFKINCPASIAEIFMEEMRHLQQEYFKVLYLNTKHEIMGDNTITIGTINSSLVHPREVFREAIKKGATSIVLIHNHPSGDPTPSNEDTITTSRIVKVGELIGINVLDHIIIGNTKYVSFKEKGML